MKNKTLAQLAYEAFSASFGIDIVQPNGRNRTVTGAIPWNDLPAGERRRWANVALAVKNEITRQQIRPAETVQCRCGARHMRGENHICNDDPNLVARLSGRG